MKRYVLSVFFLVFLTSPYTLQAANYGPCQKAVRKHCADIDPKDQLLVIQCLKINDRHITPACENHIDAMKKARKDKKKRDADTVSECRTEQRRFCGSVKPGDGRMKACLRAHKDKLSVKCKDGLKKKDILY